MGRKTTRKIGTKRTVDNKKQQLEEAARTCPYNVKICYECEIQECPEER